MSKPRVKVPKKAKAGDIINIKTLIRHKMENGQRKDKKTGKKIPRKLINNVKAEFNGKKFFDVDFHGSVSANPYLAFTAKVTEPGEFVFTWTEDGGKTFVAKKKIAVS